jgi:tRNA (cmo5U34)-methyltransferase
MNSSSTEWKHTQEAGLAWSEGDSALFVEMGRVMIPQRDEIERTIIALVPAQEDESFCVVDIAAGSGWLTLALLERFPRATAVVLDGSQTMLEEATRMLGAHAGRFSTARFELAEPDWELRVPEGVRAFVSSLALHHLDGAGKRDLFRRLYARLAPGGAVLIADIVQPASEPARRLAAEEWDAAVRAQALERTGCLDIWEFFDRERWNILRHPDPMDMPSTIAEQLEWLAAVGFTGVDVFWARAGHAVYGGYRPE